jgi:YfiH family protein
VSDDPTRSIAVRVADCVPILLATRDGNTVAAVHAGWRGTVAGVLPKTVREMGATAAPGEIVAAIGPCISFEAFEVGGDVLDEFARVFGPSAPMRRRDDGKGFVDLRECLRRQLIGAGLNDDQIDTTDRCTFRDKDEFFSHRRDHGITGRMAAIIAPRN